METRALPLVGETVTVQPKLPGDVPGLQLEGQVVYAVPNMGFAVQFLLAPETLTTIRQALDAAVDDSTPSP